MTPTKRTASTDKGNVLQLPGKEAPDESTVDTDESTKVESTKDATDTHDYVFVELPNGEVRAVPRSEIQKRSVTAQQDPAPYTEPEEEEEFYVHLANGDIERVKESDLPGGKGTNAPHGIWRSGGKVHTVIGIYPVENTVKEG